VELIGGVPYAERIQIYRNCDVLVLPSRWDGWGVVVPEAMAAGCPVIGTGETMSALEFVEDGTNGFIVAAGRADPLRLRMQWFLDHRDQIVMMGREARAAVAGYQPEAGVERMVGFVRGIVAGGVA
jgi:glycosyltransferase involved in cell wall biosynthesis